MRAFIITLTAAALSTSVALAQTPPPAGGDEPSDTSAPPPPPPNPEAEADDGPGMTEEAAPRERTERRGKRHHMGRGGPHDERGWREGMRRAQGPMFRVEIDEDGAVKVIARCGPREDARTCADVTMELLDRATGN